MLGFFQKKSSFRIGIVLALFSLYTTASFARVNRKPAEVDPGYSANPVNFENAQQDAIKKSIDQFTKFTQEKNVMGKPAGPDGKFSKGGPKTNFDKDGGGVLPFQSDLTYHDFAYDSTEQVKDANAPGGVKNQTLVRFISEHGKIAGGGGSSVMERKAYEIDKKFSDPNNPANKTKPQKGTEYKNAFKVETVEVEVDKNGRPPATPGDPDNTKIPIQRWTFRDEAKKEIAKVGEDSAEGVKKASKAPENQDNKEAMEGLTEIYEGARRATVAMWDRAIQKLGQRRAAPDRENDGDQKKMKLNESTPTCDAAFKAQVAQIDQKLPQAEIQKQTKDFEKRRDQCKQLVKQNYSVVNPKFVQNNNNGGNGQDELKTGDVNKEDGIERDLRVQLTLWGKAGKSINSVESAWKYKPEDEKSEETQYSETGEKQGTKQVTLGDQIDSWKQNQDAAQKSYDEAAKYFPNQPKPDFSKTAIEKSQKSIVELNQETENQMSAYGMTKAPDFKPPQNYDELMSGGQQ